MLVEAQGLPVGVAVTGANVHEVPQVQAVLDARPVLPPPAEGDFAPGFCADKGYDAEAIRRLLAQWGCRARRRVVERTPAWFNRFRCLLICWEKKVTQYEAFLHLAFANTV